MWVDLLGLADIYVHGGKEVERIRIGLSGKPSLASSRTKSK